MRNLQSSIAPSIENSPKKIKEEKPASTEDYKKVYDEFKKIVKGKSLPNS